MKKTDLMDEGPSALARFRKALKTIVAVANAQALQRLDDRTRPHDTRPATYDAVNNDAPKSTVRVSPSANVMELP
jgi:hypothetical protein